MLGALVVNLLYNFLTSEQDFGLFKWSPAYWPILLGLIFILVVLYLPNGLIEIKDHVRDRFSSFKRSKS